jgi:hypothetical protein
MAELESLLADRLRVLEADHLDTVLTRRLADGDVWQGGTASTSNRQHDGSRPALAEPDRGTSVADTANRLTGLPPPWLTTRCERLRYTGERLRAEVAHLRESTPALGHEATARHPQVFLATYHLPHSPTVPPSGSPLLGVRKGRRYSARSSRFSASTAPVVRSFENSIPLEWL